MTEELRKRIEKIVKDNPGIRIGEILVKAGLITGDDVNAVLEKQKEMFKNMDSKDVPKLGEILVEMGLIKEEIINDIVEIQTCKKTINLKDYKLTGQERYLVSRDIACKFNFVPLWKNNNVLNIAMANAYDDKIIDNIEEKIGLKIEAMFANGKHIKKLLGDIYKENLIKLQTVKSDIIIHNPDINRSSDSELVNENKRRKLENCSDSELVNKNKRRKLENSNENTLGK